MCLSPTTFKLPLKSLNADISTLVLETLEAMAKGVGATVSDIIGISASVASAQFKKAQDEVEKAMAMLYEYRQVVEREVVPPKKRLVSKK